MNKKFFEDRKFRPDKNSSKIEHSRRIVRRKAPRGTFKDFAGFFLAHKKRNMTATTSTLPPLLSKVVSFFGCEQPPTMVPDDESPRLNRWKCYRRPTPRRWSWQGAAIATTVCQKQTSPSIKPHCSCKAVS